MAKKRKKQIARKQRKQRKQNLTGLDFDALIALRNQVDEALTGYRSTLEPVGGAGKLGRIAWWQGCARHPRKHVERAEGCR